MLKRTALAFLFALPPRCPRRRSGQDKTITVFAAASMKNAIDDIDAAFTKATGIKAVASLAASSALANQIEQGAPADVFASADLEWMDYLENKKLIKDDTRVNLLGNKLVLIAPKDSKLNDVTIGPGFDIARLAGDGRIAAADVRAVPAGKYAKAALEKLGAWDGAEEKLAMAENVRAALALVGRGEAPLGIVYETDAKIEQERQDRRPLPGRLPSAHHLSGGADQPSRGGAVSRLPALGVAKTIFETYGFTFLIKPVVMDGRAASSPLVDDRSTGVSPSLTSPTRPRALVIATPARGARV